MNRKPLSLFLLLGVICASSMAGAAGWSSFWDVDYKGVHVSPTPESGVLSYTVTLDSDATMTFVDTAPTGYTAGLTYGVGQIQGFYLASSSESDKTITASDAVGGNTGWSWDTVPNASAPGPYSIVGWKAKNNASRITPSSPTSLGSYTFKFGSLAYDGTFNTNYHFGLELMPAPSVGVTPANSSGLTFFVKSTPDNPPPGPGTMVPEPMAMVLFAMGLGSVVLKRRFAG